MQKRTSVLEGALLDGQRDYVAASWVYSLAIEAGVDSDNDRRALSVGVIAELIVTGLMVAGGLGPDGFEAWDCSESEAVNRIVSHWALNGNAEPISNEIVWLEITAKGRRLCDKLDI